MISLLYVDDDPALLEIGRQFLELTGDFRVTLQNSASAALALLRTTRFDAIISDYQMPEMDGLEFLRRVRQEFEEIPFILFTGRGREEVVILALNSGADFYLQKGGEPRSQFAELAHKIRLAVGRRNAERALAESERRYRDVVETQTEFICRFRPDGTLEFVNEAYCRYFGRERGEIVGHRFVPEMPEEERERIRAHIRTLTPDRPVAELEHRIVMPDGSVRWHWWSDRAIFDDGGHLLGYQSVGKDITDRKTAEEALAESNARLRNLGENLPGVIFQFELTAEGKYRFPYISGRWGRVFNPDVSVARNIPDLVMARIVPEDMAAIYRSIEQSAATLTPWQMEFRAEVDGRIMWVFGRSIPERSRPDGSILWNGVLIDITERKEAEAALKESEEKFRVLAETVPVSICVFQGEHDVYVNDYTSRVTGRSKQEICSMKFWDGIHPDSREIIRSRGLARLRGENVPSHYEVKYLTKAGEVRWADITVGTIVFGGARAGLATLVDITNRKRAEEALRKSEKDYRSIIENIQDAFYRTDTQGNLVLVSPSFARLFGYSEPEEVLGLNIRDTFYFSPEERDRLLRTIIEEGTAVEFTLTLRHRSGTPVIVSASSHVHRNDKGEADGVEGILRDVSDRVAVESVFSENEQNYRELFEAVPVIICEMDPSLRITYANRTALSAMGYTAGEMTGGADLRRIVDPASHAALLGDFEMTAKSGPVHARECRMVRKDGSTFPVLFHPVPVRHGGKVAGYRGVMLDLSVTKTLERSLEAYRENLRSIVDLSLDGIIIVDLSGRLLFANRKIGEMIGFDPHGDLQTVGPIFSLLDPEFRERALAEFSLVVEGKGSYLAVYRITTLTKKELWIECIGKLIPYRGDAAVLLSIRDITSRKEMEGTLRESEERYRNLADCLPDYVLVHTEGRILYANRAVRDALGLTLRQMEGKTVFDFVSDESRRWILENMRRRAAGESTGPFEIEVFLAGGEKRHGLVNAVPSHYQGKPATLLVLTDITDRKRAEKALAQVNAKLLTLSSITRHDLQNKLTAMRAYLELSRKEAEPYPRLREFVQREQEIAAVMNDQINFSGFYQNIGVKTPEWTPVGEAFRSAGRRLSLDNIRLNIQADGVEVYADPMIGSAFYNLMENSLRHGKHVTAISVLAKPSGNDLVIEYCDDGEGVPENEKERIFERGFGKHSGLGLFLIREILSITEMTIRETGLPGKGVRFVISVPEGMFRYVAARPEAS